ncbi:MAG: PEP-CTERM sorting domain-containing protein [Proteobacteria bacterium]|nr:PEP-CTERM sorting domain-containing protein [Pseudomonadota bacterium]
MQARRTFHRSVLGAAALWAMAPAAYAADYTWTSGSYPSDTGFPSLIGAGDTLAIQAGGYKYLNGALTNAGSIVASDDLYFQNGNTLSNSGLFDWTTDSSFYDGGYNGAFVNTGTLRKSGGTGTSYVSINGFSNSGTIDVQTGTINFNTGATFNAGSSFTGAGSAVVSSGANFNGAFTSQNLVLAGGNYAGSGAQVNGNVSWTGGSLTGSWAIASGQTLATSAGGYKYIDGAVANAGTLSLGDDLYFQNGYVVTNTGTIKLAGDYGLYDGGYNGGVANSGTLSKTAGSGTSYVSINNFVNSGKIDAQTGTINFNTGASFLDGTSFTGAGQVVISNGASFTGTFTTAANLSLAGGAYTGAGSGAVIDGDTHFSAGYLNGNWQLNGTRTLTLDTGGYKYVNGTVVNLGSIVANDTLYFANGNTLTNNGSYAMAGDVGVADGGYNGSFINNGTFAKTAGAGTSYVSINGYSNNGVIRADSGTIEFSTGGVFNAGSQFAGGGTVRVTGNATFNGAYTTTGNLQLAGATYTGNGALMNGDTTWTAGYLTGDWQVASGRTLQIATGGYKYVDGGVTNNGTVHAVDDLYFVNGNTLTNNGVYTLDGDVGLYDGGYNGNFVNNGRLSKSSGGNTSYVGINGFQNHGIVDAQTGTINFYTGGLFDDGSQFTGAGQVVVSNGATFRGSFSTAGNLSLTGGTFQGGDGTAGSKATLAGGSASWTSGSLIGTWQVGSGTTLNLAAGGYKYVNGSVTNDGHVVATDHAYLQNGNTLTNNGTYEAQGDVGLYDGGYNGHFVNAGTFVKSAGGGTTDVSAIDFQNTGTVNVATGTIKLPNGFANAGVLTGVGAFQTDTLTNNGHVAPGNGAGMLTLNGNFLQTALGTLDTQLASTLSFDTLVVNGTASLDGTLALSCIGGCAIHTGDSFVILDATGDLSGTFANVTTQGFGNGFQYSVVYDRGDDLVRLDIVNAGVMPVPEPGSWALMAAGLGVFGLLARRRRDVRA